MRMMTLVNTLRYLYRYKKQDSSYGRNMHGLTKVRSDGSAGKGQPLRGEMKRLMDLKTDADQFEIVTLP